jgi:hypothetical protein
MCLVRLSPAPPAFLLAHHRSKITLSDQKPSSLLLVPRKPVCPTIALQPTTCHRSKKRYPRTRRPISRRRRANRNLNTIMNATIPPTITTRRTGKENLPSLPTSLPPKSPKRKVGRRPLTKGKARAPRLLPPTRLLKSRTLLSTPPTTAMHHLAILEI